jgi:hypothetical protein
MQSKLTGYVIKGIIPPVESQNIMKSVAILFVCSVAASAVCVNGYPNVRKEFANSEFVLTGKVVSETSIPASADGYFLEGSTYRVMPTHIYKGTVKGSMDLFSENSSGRFPMQPGKEYLLFVDGEHGRLVVDNCGNSDLISHARKAVASVARLSAKR